MPYPYRLPGPRSIRPLLVALAVVPLWSCGNEAIGPTAVSPGAETPPTAARGNPHVVPPEPVAEWLHGCFLPSGNLYLTGAVDGQAECRSVDHALVSWLREGRPGAEGPPGPAGGVGRSCWDLDGDGAGGEAEDRNGDGHFDAADCQGPTGPRGEDGAEGVRGPVGSPCWDRDHDGAGGTGEDVNGDGHFDVLDCRGLVLPFAGRIASADGFHWIEVRDDGIEVRAPQGRILLSGATLTLEGVGGLAAAAGTVVSVDAGVDLSLSSGGPLLVEGSAALDLGGGVVRLGCGAGVPLARAGDPHNGHLFPLPPPPGGPGGFSAVPGVVTAGSPTVLSC